MSRAWTATGRLPLVVAVVSVFAISYAAASQLVVTQSDPPIAGSADSGSCQDGAVSIGYSVTDGTVRTLELSGLSPACDARGRLTVQMEAAYLPPSSSPATSWSTDMTSGTTLSIPLEDVSTGIVGIPFADYSTGSITVYVLPKTGVVGAP